MKSYLRSIIVTGALMSAASGLMAQSGPTYFEQWYKAKYGHPTASEEARLKAERANSAYREEKTPAAPQLSYMDQFFKAKLGVYTPATEARLRVERENSAFRSEPQHAPAQPSYIDQWLRVKQGVIHSK